MGGGDRGMSHTHRPVQHPCVRSVCRYRVCPGPFHVPFNICLLCLFAARSTKAVWKCNERTKRDPGKITFSLYFLFFSLSCQGLLCKLWNFCILVWSHRTVLEQIPQFHLWLWFDLRMVLVLLGEFVFPLCSSTLCSLATTGDFSVSAIDPLETFQILKVGMLRDGKAAEYLYLVQSKAPGLHI